MARSSPYRSTVFRLSLAATAVLGLVALAIVQLIAGATNAGLTRATEDALQADIAALKRDYASGGLEALAAAIADRMRHGSPGLYLLLDAQGRHRAGNIPDWPSTLRGAPRAGVFSYRAETPTPGQRTAAGLLITLDGGASLTVARDIESQRALLSSLNTYLVFGLGTLVVLGLAGGYLLARAILNRIDGMQEASAAIMAGDLSGRIPVAGSGDELDRLAVQLNGMLERIEQLMAGLREVSDNIAHDLKTPLNRLRNAAEAALADQRGPDAWRTGLERTIDEADELLKTFNALLLIARLEAGFIDESFTRVDLVDICRGVADLYEPAAEEHGLVVTVDAPAPAILTANRHLIAQAIANCVDNAIKYGSTRPPGPGTPAGAIAISIATSPTHAIVSVADRGPGISAADRGRALRRFVRLDQSRTRPGTGLGLSLVAAVAHLHQGEVRLEDNDPGLRVVLALPLAQAKRVVASSAKPFATRAAAPR